MEVESISSEDEIDENALLEQYFKDQNYWLKTTPLSEVPKSLQYEIAILFYITTKDMDWMEFAYELGLKTIVIYAIECKSRTGIPALYLVFKLLHRESFGEIMELFSKKRKFHILKHVKPFVEDLVSKRNIAQPSAPLLSQESNSIKSSPEGSKDNESAPLQKSHLKTSTVKENFKDTLPRSITVFIQHALSDEEPAQKLAIVLRKSKMRVILSKDVFPFLRINQAQILKALNKRVDFIIPIMSDELQEQIGSRKTKVDCGTDLETSSNRFLHDLVSHEYFNSLKNYRVRPVIDRSKVKDFAIKDSLLSTPFRLWNEVPLLIENLKVTKKWF